MAPITDKSANLSQRARVGNRNQVLTLIESIAADGGHAFSDDNMLDEFAIFIPWHISSGSPIRHRSAPGDGERAIFRIQRPSDIRFITCWPAVTVIRFRIRIVHHPAEKQGE